jgi:DNA polymerase-4
LLATAGENKANWKPVRTIFHVDMDAFFVSVEELFDPSLKGQPVVVGGPRDQRGVVAAASYAARKFGVHSAMPLRLAAQKCPQAIFLEGHPDRYREYSHRVHAVLQEFSPLVQMASVDEAYLDLTGSLRLFGSPFQAAHRLHERMKQATGLNCSIGISTSRLVSKVGSDQAKPNGVIWIQPGLEAAFLAPLEVRRLPGVGKVMEQRLHELGIRRVGDLARLDEEFLRKRFGAWGLALAGKSQGLEAGGWFDHEIGESEAPKSISHEHTYGEDTSDLAQLEATLTRLTEKVARRLREHGLYARTVQLKLRYSDFTTLTRARTLAHPTQLDGELIAATRELFHSCWKPGAKIRLLGAGVSGFEESAGQLDLLNAESNERAARALAAADKLRDKYGEKIVSLASGMRGATVERVQENPVGLPGKGPRRTSGPQAPSSEPEQGAAGPRPRIAEPRP